MILIYNIGRESTKSCELDIDSREFESILQHSYRLNLSQRKRFTKILRNYQNLILVDYDHYFIGALFRDKTKQIEVEVIGKSLQKYKEDFYVIRHVVLDYNDRKSRFVSNFVVSLYRVEEFMFYSYIKHTIRKKFITNILATL